MRGASRPPIGQNGQGDLLSNRVCQIIGGKKHITSIYFTFCGFGVVGAVRAAGVERRAGRNGAPVVGRWKGGTPVGNRSERRATDEPRRRARRRARRRVRGSSGAHPGRRRANGENAKKKIRSLNPNPRAKTETRTASLCECVELRRISSLEF